MKNKHSLLHTALTLALIGASTHSSYALNINNNTLSFDAGITTTSTYGTVLVPTGSYFAMDTNGDGRFSTNERIAISTGPLGGITLGALQPATGSHGGCPDGTESPGPDAPWCFFGNTGMHQVTGNPVINNGDGTLNFSGWGVVWNGIANIPMGGDPANFPADTGIANISCDNTPCLPDDVQNLDYFAHVPAGDPSNFGGVAYSLHLANVVYIPTEPVALISLVVTDGNTQECNSTGGNTISVQSSITVPTDDAIEIVNWSVDGVVVASGENLMQYISLGNHRIDAEVITVNGVIGNASTEVSISDTTSPEVTAAFIDKRHDTVITSIQHRGKLKIQAEAQDICDASPVVTSMIGAPVEDNDIIRVSKENDYIKLNVPSLTLSVSASDSSGNSASAQTTLDILE